MNREETRKIQPPCHGRYKPCHPVIAMDQIRLYLGNNVVDDLPLKGKRYLYIFRAIIGIDMVQIEENPVFSKMNPLFR